MRFLKLDSFEVLIGRLSFSRFLGIWVFVIVAAFGSASCNWFRGDFKSIFQWTIIIIYVLFFVIKMYSYFLELMYNVPQQYNDLKSHITEMTHFDGHNWLRL